MKQNNHGSPESHPHADRPNWQPAETFEDFLRNCREGIEQYSDRRAAQLLGWPRIKVYRAKMIANIPDDLLERLMTLEPVPKVKQLAAVGHLLSRIEGDDARNVAEVERCPRCGGVVRVRPRVSQQVATVVNNWMRAIS